MRRLARPLAALTLAAAALTAAGCGKHAEKEAVAGEPVREGLSVPVGDAHYNVFITRQLNPRDPEDAEYLGRGAPDPPKGQALYGVFIQACNFEGEKPVETAREFKITDILGNEFKPAPLPEENVFAYRPGRLQPEECFPNEASATSYGPNAGSLILFRLPVGTGENRPLELEIEGEPDAATGRRPLARIELDL